MDGWDAIPRSRDRAAPEAAPPRPERGRDNVRATGSYQELKFRAVALMHDFLDAKGWKAGSMRAEALRAEIARIVSVVINGANVALNGEERRQLTEEVQHELVGLGPLEPLLADPDIDDITVNGPGHVYVERGGRLEPVNVRFRDDAHLMGIIQRMVSPLGRRVDEANPFVDARLPDGSRVNVVVPPVAIDGPIISIRKFKRIPLAAEDLLQIGTMSEPMLDYLRAAVRARLSILISGGTGAGKTTLLNILSSFIGEHERLVTIEDAAELQLQQPHVVRMETRPAGSDGARPVTARDLVANALRMRPDRIILGEVRGGEAVDMLQAMTTGHDGSMATVHANNPRDALTRLELLLSFGGVTADIRTVRRQIVSAIQVAVQVERNADGERRVVNISEIAGMEGDTITLNERFSYEHDGDGSLGVFRRVSAHSQFAARLRRDQERRGRYSEAS